MFMPYSMTNVIISTSYQCGRYIIITYVSLSGNGTGHCSFLRNCGGRLELLWSFFSRDALGALYRGDDLRGLA